MLALKKASNDDIQQQTELYLPKQTNVPKGDIHHWTDLYIGNDKRAGYVLVTKGYDYIIGAYGANDRNGLIKRTKGVTDCYITLNGFDVTSWKVKDLQDKRKTENAKQIRIVAVDVDQYKKGITIPDALDEINRLIDNGTIPMPNLVLTSRGIQLFYSIKGGASPYKSGQTEYITNQFIKKLAHIGADNQATGVTRLMRAPNSINSRNGTTVHPQIWNNNSFTLWELLAYTSEPKISKKVIPINVSAKSMYRLNKARINDFDKLIELRNGNLTGMRNAFLYNYVFHLSLLDQNYDRVTAQASEMLSKITTTNRNGAPLTPKEIVLTTASAYDDAGKFILWFQENKNKIVFSPNDGVIKPKKVSTLIDQLNITISEQHYMTTLATQEILDLNRKRLKELDRRKRGVREMSAYQNERKTKQQENIQQLSELMKQHPDYTNQQYANIMGLSERTIRRFKKEI